MKILTALFLTLYIGTANADYIDHIQAIQADTSSYKYEEIQKADNMKRKPKYKRTCLKMYKDGKLIKKAYQLESKKYYHVSHYFYNDKGLLSREEDYFGTGRLNRVYKYSYDDSDKLIKIEDSSYNRQLVIKYFYYSNGSRSSTSTMILGSNREHTERYWYDTLDNGLIKTYRSDSEANFGNKTNQYLAVETIKTDNWEDAIHYYNGVVTGFYRTFYDEQGRVIKDSYLSFEETEYEVFFVTNYYYEGNICTYDFRYVSRGKVQETRYVRKPITLDKWSFYSTP